MTKARRLLVLEEPLRDHLGHYFEYARMLADSNRRAGVEVELAVHKDALPEVLEELGATPVFRFTTWDGLYERQGITRWIDHVQHGLRLLRDLRSFLRTRETYDLIYVATVSEHQLLGFRILAALGGSHFRKLVLHMRLSFAKYPESSDKPVFKKKMRGIARILRSFAGPVASGRVRFVTDSRRLASEFSQLCGLDADVFPHPAMAGPVAPPLREPGPLRFSTLGPARGEKGTMDVQNAIRLFFQRQPDLPIRFVIHWGARTLDPSLTRYPDLEADERVLFLDRDLDTEEYRRRLTASDCILVPYHRERYAARISGVSVEAATTGIPMIYTQETWLEDAAHEWGAGLGVRSGDAEDLADKIHMMAADIEKYRAAARERAEVARRYHSPENHQSLLWKDEG